jgi:ubiquinone/menaquinone biosynthesis C-methylase UbiE
VRVAAGNDEQFAAWNGESGERWVSTADRRDAVLAPVADALLAVADPRPGERVLDLGCGCGVTTLAAARLVGGSGAATGVDLSEPMLEVARRRAADEGLDQARFLQADVQTADLPGDADLVIGRFGTMFYADPIAAFANVARSMSTGGRLCLATWQPLLDNEWIVVPGGVLLRFGSMPDAGRGPGMFAQSDPEVVTDVLESAGFASLVITPVAVELQFGDDVDAAIEHLTDSGPARAVLDTVPEGHRDSALAALAEALTAHAGPDGVRLGAGIWLIEATTA